MAKWPSINPGELRKKVELQEQTTAQDSIGQNQQIWNSRLTNWPAAIDDAVYEQRPDGREYADQGLIYARATHIITIRWTRFDSSGQPLQIVPGMRIFYADQLYSPPALHYYFVEWVENVEQRNVLIRVVCREINAEA